jgi:two-component system KDP operon response regulator KdpE
MIQQQLPRSESANQQKPRVLVVDDEPAIRRFLRTLLSAHDFTVFEASSGNDLLSEGMSQRPDVIVLDLGLPDLDGVQITRLLREWTQLPIIILSVRGSEADKIAALDAGADDYVTKPFNSGELLARLRSALRRASRTPTGPVFVDGDLKVDLARRLVTVANQEVQLTPTEFDLLKTLVINADKVVTQRQLLKEVWGQSYQEDFHILHVNISNLRRKIEPRSGRYRHIITEPGVGYRMRVSLDE